MKVEREPPARERGSVPTPAPTLQQFAVMVAGGPVRVIVANDFLGKTFNPAKRPSAGSKSKSPLWLRRSLSNSFSVNNESKRADGGIHLRSGQSRGRDESDQSQAAQQRQK